MECLLKVTTISLRMEKQLEQKVLARIRPDTEETGRIESAAAEVARRVEAVAPRYEGQAGGLIRPVLVGSVAKGTFLKEADVDLFMTFPVSAPREVLEKVGLSIGKEVLDEPIVKYAEHPYMRGKMGGVNVDLVPCYAITDPSMKMSAVDRTPFQSDYVNRNMQIFQRDEVRLLKRFFKGIGVYGAEAKVSGFSGYLCELLIMNYVTFISTIQAISQWTSGEMIQIPGTALGEKLTSSDALLTLPDPVDGDRNVAAALGANPFSTAVIASRRFLKKPEMRFFFPRDPVSATVAEIRRKMKETGHGLLLLRLDRAEVVDDNLYPQIQKARRNIAALLEKNGFEVNRSVYNAGKDIRILFELRNSFNPQSWLREGPAGWSENSSAFIDKHRRAGGTISLIDGILYSEEEKPFGSPADLLREGMGKLSLGADLDKLKRTATVHGGDEVVTAANREILSSLLFPSFPWER